MQGHRDPGGQGQGGGPSFKCPDSCPSVFCTHWSLGPTPKGATLSLRVAGSLGPRGMGRSGTQQGYPSSWAVAPQLPVVQLGPVLRPRQAEVVLRALRTPDSGAGFCIPHPWADHSG
ncbi:unnamed protein product [Rangifer tarandus platyrhynchus]|uniref:Uncharacterized protein n=2 Tax=Rangifer tarandus platyrhynchus TaxID=3082113 RepID=A0AC59Y3R2_RANTA|nr:unnamed protein product [Rangifer tarandus platyrhynchus]